VSSIPVKNNGKQLRKTGIGREGVMAEYRFERLDRTRLTTIPGQSSGRSMLKPTYICGK